MLGRCQFPEEQGTAIFSTIWPRKEAHSARYDTEKTAELFCGIVNRWKEMGGRDDFDQ